nr:unnamed protein product [Digitaria exilis]
MAATDEAAATESPRAASVDPLKPRQNSSPCRPPPLPSSLVLVVLVLCFHGRGLHATDTLTVARPLTGDQKLISERGKFALGFFQPQDQLSSSVRIAAAAIYAVEHHTAQQILASDRSTRLVPLHHSQRNMHPVVLLACFDSEGAVLSHGSWSAPPR